MTRKVQKDRERFFVEEAARSLGLSWTIVGDTDPPDFIVEGEGARFGLEVRDIFSGPQSVAGSVWKQGESVKHRFIDSIRLEYERAANCSLDVKFVGRVGLENKVELLKRLIDVGFPALAVGQKVVLELSDGLRVHATKAFRPNWYSVNDRVGFVDRNPQRVIISAIDEKARKLARYLDRAGEDIRLLLVANRIFNSGKLALEPDERYDFKGFRAVYFFPYPEPAVVLPELDEMKR